MKASTIAIVAASLLLLLFAAFKIGEKRGQKDVETLSERLRWADERVKVSESLNESMRLSLDSMSMDLDTLRYDLAVMAIEARILADRSRADGASVKKDLNDFMSRLQQQEREESELRSLAKMFID